VVHDLFDLFVADKGTVAAHDLGSARHIEHVTHAKELLGPHLAQDRTAVDFRGHLEGNPRREVRLDRAGDDIDRRTLCRHDQVNTRGPRHLRQTLDAGFDLFARDHHQVGHLIHDHDDIGQRFGLEFIRLKDRLARIFVKAGLDGAAEHLSLGQGLADTTVIAFDVAHAHLGHLAIALFHLAHGPLQRDNGLFRVGHNGGQQMRDAVIDRQFQHLGVDHDHPAFFRRQLVQQRQDHCVDRNGFTRTSGPRDQQVRHLGKVRDHRVTANVFAQGQRQAHGAVAEITRSEDFTQHDFLAVLVR